MNIKEQRSFVQQSIEKIRTSLLDLTRRNRLLNFRMGARSLTIVDELPDQVFDHLVNEGKPMTLEPVAEPDLFEESSEAGVEQTETSSGPTGHREHGERPVLSDELPTESDGHKDSHYDDALQTKLFIPELETKLRRMRSDARSIIEETGRNQLYLALGFLRWKEHDTEDDWNEAPLILIPVELEKSRLDKSSGCYRYTLAYTDDEVSSNLSLKEKLERDFDVALPPLHHNNGTEEDELIPEDYFASVTSAISEIKAWKISRRMVLGFFSFTKLLMYKDLDGSDWEGEDNLIDHETITSLILGSESDTSGTSLSESELEEDKADVMFPLVLDADGSQLEVIAAASEGSNLVVHGPPGTGKSQTITNLIAYYLAAGKSVIFMSEKLAALNVVQRNLEKVGLSDFCLELHSHKISKKRVHEALERRLSSKFRKPRDIDSNINYLRQQRHILAKYVKALHSYHKGTQKTLFELIGRCELLRTRVSRQPGLRVSNVSQLTAESINEGRTQLDFIAQFASRPIPPWRSAWQHYDAVTLYVGDEEVIGEALSESISRTEQLVNTCETLSTTLDCSDRSGNWSLKTLERIAHISTLQMPDATDEELLTLILKNYDSDFQLEIDRLSKLIAERLSFLTPAEGVMSIPPSLTEQRCSDLSSSVRSLCELRFEHLALKSLLSSKTLFAEADHLLGDASQHLKNLSEYGISVPLTIGGVTSAAQIIDHLRTRPGLVESPFFECLTDDPARTQVENALALREHIDNKTEQLSQSFALSDLPELSDLKFIRQTVRKYRKHWFRVFFREYRHAKRRLMAFYVGEMKPTNPSLLDGLEELEKFINSQIALTEMGAGGDVLSQLLSFDQFSTSSIEAALHWIDELSILVGNKRSAISIAQVESGLLSQLSEQEICKSFKSLWDELTGKFTDLLGEDHQIIIDAQDKESLISKLAGSFSTVRKILNDLTASIDRCNIDRAAAEPMMMCQLLNWIECVEKVFSLDTAIANSTVVIEKLGPYFAGHNTDIDRIQHIIDWRKSLYKLTLPAEVHDGLLVRPIMDQLETIREITKDWHDNIATIRSLLVSVDEYGTMDWIATLGSDFDETSISDLVESLLVLKGEVSDVPSIADYVRARHKAESTGLKEYVGLMEQGQVEPEKSSDQWELTVLSRLVQTLIAKSPILNSFTAEEHQEVRQRFVDLDLTIQQQNIQKIASLASQAKPPVGIGRGPVREWTNLSLIQREIIKSRRHIPIRQLMIRAGDAVKALTPVLMMSPLSVAQFIRPKVCEYDVLIMDEASQIRPEEALGAIGRVKQVVVVGDPKQLPPTSFFNSNTDGVDEDLETPADDTDSILDMCIATNMNQRHLRWHYRSEHEGLIAFSNSNWYDNRLIIFPTTDQSHVELGVHYHYVNQAKYANGKNAVEARAVAHAVFEHLRMAPEWSIGVGTFGLKQQRLIEDEIERMAKQNPSFRDLIDSASDSSVTHEPFFVKNLENIQGDERDVIVVSTTYGPDIETGKVFQRFGPINSKHGSRRLNVLFTRARKRLDVYSSMTPDDIHSGPDRPLGAIALSRYLSYAKTGILPQYGEATDREPDSDFELAVAHALHTYGYETKLQLGVSGYFIDVAVKDPDRDGMFLLAVECDGATYHSDKYARDRDRLKDEVLKRRGWQVFRIWSTDWFKNRDAVVKRLLVKLNDIRSKRTVFVESTESSDSISAQLDSEPVSNAPIPAAALAERLTAYAKQYSGTDRFKRANCLLSEEMFRELVKHRPTDMGQFRQKIPARLRQDIDPDDFDILDDLIGIIEGGNNSPN